MYAVHNKSIHNRDIRLNYIPLELPHHIKQKVYGPIEDAMQRVESILRKVSTESSESEWRDTFGTLFAICIPCNKLYQYVLNTNAFGKQLCCGPLLTKVNR